MCYCKGRPLELEIYGVLRILLKCIMFHVSTSTVFLCNIENIKSYLCHFYYILYSRYVFDYVVSL
jgi:hypothetical protein